MFIEVENHYEKKDSGDYSEIKVYCRSIKGKWHKLPAAKPTGMGGGWPTSPKLPGDTIELYVEETHPRAGRRRGKKKFSKIIVSIDRAVKWNVGSTIAGGILAKGYYNKKTKIAKIQIVPFGPTTITTSPTTVNVQVGGN